MSIVSLVIQPLVFFSSTSKEEALVLYKKNAALLINWLGKIAFEKAYKQNSDNTQNESI